MIKLGKFSLKFDGVSVLSMLVVTTLTIVGLGVTYTTPFDFGYVFMSFAIPILYHSLRALIPTYGVTYERPHLAEITKKTQGLAQIGALLGLIPIVLKVTLYVIGYYEPIWLGYLTLISISVLFYFASDKLLTELEEQLPKDKRISSKPIHERILFSQFGCGGIFGLVLCVIMLTIYQVQPPAVDAYSTLSKPYTPTPTIIKTVEKRFPIYKGFTYLNSQNRGVEILDIKPDYCTVREFFGFLRQNPKIIVQYATTMYRGLEYYTECIPYGQTGEFPSKSDFYFLVESSSTDPEIPQIFLIVSELVSQ